MEEDTNNQEVQRNTSQKIDTILNHLEISVSESEKRVNGSLNLRDFYTVYLIEIKVTDPNLHSKLGKLTTVWRRYTEFEQLRDYLEITYPYIILPPLPEKRVMFAWQKISNDTFDPNFIDRRRVGLENFLLRISAHPVLTWDTHFLEFLQQEEGWRESYKANGYIQLVENKLKSISVAVRLKKPDQQFETIKDYGLALHTNLSNLLKARSRVAEKQYMVHKLHANYGRVFSEWSVIEKEMGDALQKTGHYLDSLAACIDTSLEDEELLADQLKEYLFFAYSLQNVCKNHEVLQLQLEDAEENVSNKNVERIRVQQGKTGLMSRLFGAVDTDEVKEFKVSLLDKQIEESATAVNNAKENLRTSRPFYNDKKMDEKSDSNSVKMGFGIWMLICFCICLWFWKSFSKGRQQFQNNLHVIEDGLRKMQESIELKQRENSMGCIEDVEDLSSFMEKFRKANDADKERQENSTKEEELNEEEQQRPKDLLSTTETKKTI